MVRMPEVNSVSEASVHVKMKTADEALKAITTLNGRTFDGRRLSAKYFPSKEFDKLEKTTTSYHVAVDSTSAGLDDKGVTEKAEDQTKSGPVAEVDDLD